jgi:hypothetical protein
VNKDLLQAVTTTLSVLIGGLITWAVSRYYYLRAARELQLEVDELRRLSNLMVQGLEGTGLVEWTRDSSGRPVSMIYKATVSMTTAGLSASGRAEAAPGDAETRPRR